MDQQTKYCNYSTAPLFPISKKAPDFISSPLNKKRWADVS
jgi:hypothetical protein